MTNSYSIKNYLIIGASSGIGYAVTKQLVDDGHRLFTLSRRPLPPQFSGKTSHLQWDVTDASEQEYKLQIPDSLDGLVYCPGSITLKPFNRLNDEDFLNDFQVNVVGAVRIIQAALPALKKGGQSSVVVFSTVAARIGMRFHASIAAAKSALEGLVRSLAAEYAGSGIRFNAIAPSITDTSLAERLLNSESKRENLAAMHPLSGIGSAEEIAGLTRYLLSPQTRWITGQVFAYDGGLATLKKS